MNDQGGLIEEAEAASRECSSEGHKALYKRWRQYRWVRDEEKRQSFKLLLKERRDDTKAK